MKTYITFGQIVAAGRHFIDVMINQHQALGEIGSTAIGNRGDNHASAVYQVGRSLTERSDLGVFRQMEDRK